MQITHEEFLKMQEERQARASNNFTPRSNSADFLKLADGEKCLLRFSFNTPNELPIYTVHKVTVDGKFRNINCIRNFRDPIDKCPLCAADKPYKQVVYITAIRYITDEDGQLVKSQPVIWERPTGFLKDLNSYYNEYGDLSEMVFTLERTGQMKDTRYNLMPKNAAIFNKQAYPADFSAFENFNPMGGLILDKSYDELVDISAGVLPTAKVPMPGAPVADNRVVQEQAVAYGSGTPATYGYGAPAAYGPEDLVRSAPTVRRVTY